MEYKLLFRILPKEDLLEPILPSEATVAALVLFLLVSMFSSKGKRIYNFQFVTFRNKMEEEMESSQSKSKFLIAD